MTPIGSIGALAPTPAQLRETVTDPIVSPDYQPQYMTGKAAKLFGEYSLGMADPAIAAGPAALGRVALTNVVAPALASEAAGAATEGTPAELPARIIAALVAGHGASKAVSAIDEANAVKAATIPLDELNAKTGGSYDVIRNANVGNPLPSTALADTADTITSALNAANHRPINAGEIHGVIDSMRTPATAGAPDVADLLATRMALKDQIGSNPAAAKVAINKIEDAIDTYAPGTMADLKAADQNWSAFKTGEALDKNLARAEDTANAANSGMNLGNRIRQRAAAMKTSKQWNYMNDDQKALVQGVIDGTVTQNTLRDISNMVGKGHGIGLWATELLGLLFGHPGVGLATGFVVGRGSNMGYKGLVARQAANASDALRRMSPMGQQFYQQNYVAPTATSPLALGAGAATGAIASSPSVFPKRRSRR
jgi:hypothetical protein